MIAFLSRIVNQIFIAVCYTYFAFYLGKIKLEPATLHVKLLRIYKTTDRKCLEKSLEKEFKKEMQNLNAYFRRDLLIDLIARAPTTGVNNSEEVISSISYVCIQYYHMFFLTYV